MIRAAIFDMDGTLLDSMPAWETVGADYLRAKGIQPPPDLQEQVRDLGMRQTADYVRAHFGISDPPEQIIDDILAFVVEQYRNTIPLKAGVCAFLHKLHDAGVRLCVATASDRRVAEAALARTGVLDLFDFLLTCDEIGAGKERPLIFETAMQRLGGGKEDTVVFEDAAYAVITAARAGFRVAMVYDEIAAQEQQAVLPLAERYLESFMGCAPEQF